MSQSFGCWVEAVDAWVSERENTSHEASLAMLRAEMKAQQEKGVTKLWNRWRQQGLSKCFTSWQTWVMERRHLRRSLEKTMKRLSHGSLASAFDGWRSQTEMSRRIGETAARVIGRLQHSAVLGAFMAWSDQTRWSVRSRKIVSRMLSRWQMKEVSACFVAWCDDVRSSHLRVHTVICRSAAIVTSDPSGHARAEAVTEYPVGRVMEILETRLVGGRLRARTADGWVWYVLENGVVQLEELSSDELDRIRSEAV
ncbi:MAG: hypothetical protein VXX66_10430, partial [Actinomycetota bacterium]|nr:hypothetical protein [Actinomycetota bacterium]